MGVGYSVNGADIIPGGQLFDQHGIIGVQFDFTPTYYTSTKSPYTGQDLGAVLQTKYLSIFYADTLLCTPAAGTTNMIRGLTGDLANWFALYDSLYASLSSYNVTVFTTSGSGATQIKTSSNATVASAVYGSGLPTWPPYTYAWSLLASYGATSYAINPNTTILTPTASSTKFQQVQGTGYTKQLAQCVITDSRGSKGYSIVCVINFI